jgi:hypothetical protein
MWAVEAEGPPTSGMRQVLEEQEKELEALTRETDAFFRDEVTPLNELAKQLSLPFIIVQ